jgi:Asp-tRNA(Asn)/Glu-tRNA(Gln) amidotransferase B subunit
VTLSTENEQSLKNILEKLNKEGIDYSVFTEPDLNNELTSITISPEATEWCKRYLSSLPLAMKEYDVLNNKLSQLEMKDLDPEMAKYLDDFCKIQGKKEPTKDRF